MSIIVLWKQHWDQRVSKTSKISTDAISKMEQGIVSHWFTPFNVWTHVHFFAGNKEYIFFSNQVLLSCRATLIKIHFLQKTNTIENDLFISLRFEKLKSQSSQPGFGALKYFQPWLEVQCRIKLACLSSLSRTCFWSTFSVAETRYICFLCCCVIQLCNRISSSKNKIPIAEVSFTFQQTQREKKQAWCFTVSERRSGGDIGYDTVEVKPASRLQDSNPSMDVSFVMSMFCRCTREIIPHGGCQPTGQWAGHPSTRALYKERSWFGFKYTDGKSPLCVSMWKSPVSSSRVHADWTVWCFFTLLCKHLPWETKCQNLSKLLIISHQQPSTLIGSRVHLSDPDPRDAASHTVIIDYHVKISPWTL